MYVRYSYVCNLKLLDLRLRIEKRPPDIAGTREYIKQAVVGSQERVALQNGDGRAGNNSSPQKLTMLRNISQSPGFGLILWHDASSGKMIFDFTTRKWFFKKWDGEAWTGLFWLRIGRGGGRLWLQ